MSSRAERLARGRDVPERECDNPSCPIVYKPKSPNQRFHSVECREAYHESRAREERQVQSESATTAAAAKPPAEDGSVDELRQRYLRLLLRLVDDDGHQEHRPRVDRILAPLTAEQLVDLAEREPFPVVLDHVELALNGERPAG